MKVLDKPAIRTASKEDVMVESKHHNTPRPPKKKLATQPKRTDSSNLQKRGARKNRDSPRDYELPLEEHLAGLWKALGLT